jgi:DNA invertase Pin-like site-specific DNA recombinase
MNVVGYTRVSTEEQARDGVSLGAQEDKIHAYAVVKDWTLTELIHDEGNSVPRASNGPAWRDCWPWWRQSRWTS